MSYFTAVCWDAELRIVVKDDVPYEAHTFHDRSSYTYAMDRDLAPYMVQVRDFRLRGMNCSFSRNSRWKVLLEFIASRGIAEG